MTNTITGLDGAHELLIKLVDQSPEDWQMRKKVVQLLFDARYYRDASKMIWNAPEIPPVGKEVVFATKVVAKGQPTRAMRLVNTVIEKNLSHPEENLAMAKLFMKEGMPLQAIRFYGAATALDVKLVDEYFEIAMLEADAEKNNWQEEVTGDEFPWEGPSESKSLMTSQEKQEAHAELLNGLTQPVPMKAPVRENLPVADEKPKSDDITFDSGVEEEKQVEAVKPFAVFPPRQEEEVVEVEAKEEELQAEADEKVTESPEAISLVETLSAPEPEPEQEDAVAEETEEPEMEVTPVEEPAEELAPEEEKEDLVAKEDQKEPVPTAFFKTSDDAHRFNHEESKAKDLEAEKNEIDELIEPRAKAECVAGEQDQIAKLADALAESDDKAKAEESSHVEEQEKPNANEGNDLDSFVADTMAEYESATRSEEKKSKGVVASAFGSLLGCFRKSKKDQPVEEMDVEEEVLAEDSPFAVESAVDSDEPAKVAEAPVAASGQVAPAVAAQPAAPAVEVKEEDQQQAVAEKEPVQQAVEPAPVAAALPRPNSPTPLTRPGVHTSAQRLVSNPQAQAKTEPETPKELDGRTQLVALAPEDGRPYFEQLKAKYQNASPDQLPIVARIARDMANADYLDLIARVCVEDHKDLDAFSKMLGLHRVMTDAGCRDWAEDMNLLRKGYGDAVLATVVSRYSVSECREILNSVYQSPGKAVAG